MKLRAGVRITVICIVCLASAFYLLDRSSNAYHGKRLEASRNVLAKLNEERLSKKEVIDRLGAPWMEADSAKAIQLETSFANGAFPGKSAAYPKALIYMKGDIVNFIYLDGKEQMVDFWVARN